MNTLLTPALTGVFFILSLFTSPLLADEELGSWGYPLHAKSTKMIVTVAVVWEPSEKEVDTICNKLNDKPPSNNIAGCYDRRTNTIYAVEPISFNDGYHLVILGHEFWHALGANHP